MLRGATVYCVGKELLSEQLVTDEQDLGDWKTEASRAVRDALERAEIKFDDGGVLRLHLRTARHPHRVRSQEVTNFWPTFTWASNAWWWMTWGVI